MSANNERKPFYFNLTSNQIDDLILEHKLRHERGIRFHFIVDPYDIQKYCFPFGMTVTAQDQNKKRDVLTIEDISDEQIAYDRLFNDKETYHFVLDEHYPELVDFQMYYLSLISENKVTIFNFIEAYEKEFKNSKEKILKLIDTDDNIISLLISTCLTLEKNGMQRLNKLIEEKKIIASKKN